MDAPLEWLRDSPGSVLGLFRDTPDGLTKNEVAALAGLSRTAASERVDLLARRGYLTVRPTPASTRGRPADRFALSPHRGVILVADTGATAMRVALCDATGAVVDETFVGSDVTEGPTAVLGRIDTLFRRALARTRTAHGNVLGIAISVPGPVDHASGKVISPPIMTGWHDYDIPGYFAGYGCPTLVEKDVNAMVIGEHAQVHPDTDDMVFVKIGTGVGTGLLVRGQLYRGADGAAGDIGHVSLHEDDVDAPLCRCGNRGCVEAYAGGWALTRDLTAHGTPASSVTDIVTAVRAGNRVALDLVRTAGRILGWAVADIVNMVNPRLIVFGGQLGALDDILLANAREVIYHRSLPLATKNLRIEPSAVPNPGVIGLARLVADRIYSPEEIDAHV